MREGGAGFGSFVVLWFGDSVGLWFGGLENVGEFSVGFVVGCRFPGGLPFSFFSSLLFRSFFPYHFPGRAQGAGVCRGLRTKTTVACHLVVVA